MPKRPTLSDLAEAAGVSLATVDRVLNKRPGVRALTVQQVLKAAAHLDYLPDEALYAVAAPKPEAPPVTIAPMPCRSIQFTP